MKYSLNGLHLTEQFEGCKLIAYQDQVGIWTLGYGHIHGIRQGMTCTQEQAERWLLEDVVEAESAVNRYVSVPLTQNQYDALVDMVFNVGVGNFRSSTLLRLLNIGAYDRAANEFERWNKAGGIVRDGLTRRRFAEKNLFLKE
jgi:lysozyme